MDMRKKRNLALIICIFFVLAAFSSFFCIVEEENHVCTGADCPVCACVHQAEQILRNLSTGALCILCTAIAVMWNCVLISAVSLYINSVTLVSQKVRLND